MELKQVTIEKIATSDKKKDGSPLVDKNGKSYWKVGIKVDGQWANALSYNLDKDREVLQEGATVSLLFEQHPTYGLQFRIPGKLDLLEERVKKLESYHQNTVAVAEDEGDVEVEDEPLPEPNQDYPW